MSELRRPREVRNPIAKDPRIDGVALQNQLGLSLSAREVSAIVSWLGALTGTLPVDYIEPPSAPATPHASPD